MKDFWLGLIIFCSAYFIRYIFTFYSGLPFMSTDTYDYINMAKGIISSNPISYFPNGYPIIISFFLNLFEENNAIELLRHLNVILSSLIVLIIFLIGKKLSIKLAILSSILIIFWPNQLNYTRQLLSEVPATFFLVSGIYLFTCKNSYSIFFSGIMIAIASIIRSTILPVGIVLIIYSLIIELKNKIDISISVNKTFLLSIGFISIFIIEFVLINKGFLASSSNLDPNLTLSVHGYHLSGYLDPKKYYLYFMFSEPIDFFILRLSSFWELWGPWPNDAEGIRGMFSRIIIGLRFPLLILAILGFIISFRDEQLTSERKNIFNLLIIPVIFISLVYVMFFSTPRFSFCMEPFVILLSSNTLYRIYKFIYQKKNNQ